MSHNLLRLVALLQVLLLFLGQRLTPYFQRFVHPLDAAEANDRTRDALIDPRQRHVAHLPATLRGNLFHASDDLQIDLVFVLRSCGTLRVAACGGGTCEVAAREGRPLRRMVSRKRVF